MSKHKYIFMTLLTAGFLLLGLGASAADSPSAALKDLAATTGETITSKADAAKVCDQEKYFTICADIGKKYKLYKADEVKVVDSVISELKGKIANKIQSCTTQECLLEVAQELAQKVSSKNPTAAKELELTPQAIEQKKSQTQKNGDLEADLASGKTSCGGTTDVQSCGNYCLNPSAESQAHGTVAIPSDCRAIAQTYFGNDGVKRLEAAYSKVQKAHEQTAKQSQGLIFTTENGEVLTNPEQIGNYCENQGENGNVAGASKCLDFAEANGLIKPEDKKYALDFVKKAKEQGSQINFNKCSQDPESCRDLVPTEHKQEFEAQHQVQSILQESLGFDPRQCQQQDCTQGAAKALEKLKTLDQQSPGIQRAIQNIEQHLDRAQQFQKFQQNASQEDRQLIEQTQQKCSGLSQNPDPNLAAECVAAGKKFGIFKPQEAAEKLSNFNQSFQQQQQGQQQNQNQGYFGNQQQGDQGQSRFPGKGPYEGFQQPGQDGTRPGQEQGFTEPGRSFGQPTREEQLQYQKNQDQKQFFQKQQQNQKGNYPQRPFGEENQQYQRKPAQDQQYQNNPFQRPYEQQPSDNQNNFQRNSGQGSFEKQQPYNNQQGFPQNFQQNDQYQQRPESNHQQQEDFRPAGEQQPYSGQKQYQQPYSGSQPQYQQPSGGSQYPQQQPPSNGGSYQQAPPPSGSTGDNTGGSQPPPPSGGSGGPSGGSQPPPPPTSFNPIQSLVGTISNFVSSFLR